MPPRPSLYKYTGHDLLLEPEFYMYSTYAEKPFLHDYVRSRLDCILKLENRYMQWLKPAISEEVTRLLAGWAPLLEEVEDAFCAEVRTVHCEYLRGGGSVPPSDNIDLPDNAGAGSLGDRSTQQVLRALLRNFIDGKSEEDNLDKWAGFFLKRFEVTRKLYSHYGRGLKTADGDFDVFVNYALLSLCLMFAYRQRDNLKMLNGVLKLNDLLCSVESKLLSPEDLLLTIPALRMELDSVKMLADDKGIRL